MAGSIVFTVICSVIVGSLFAAAQDPLEIVQRDPNSEDLFQAKLNALLSEIPAPAPDVPAPAPPPDVSAPAPAPDVPASQPEVPAN